MAITSEGVIEAGKPIGGEVFTFFGVGPRSDGKYYWVDVILASNINKYSICKPIHYPKLGKLTDAERRGYLADINNGVIYGLKIGVPNNTLYNIHEANWDYVGKPYGGIRESPYRVPDLWGYDHYARPTLLGGGIKDGDTVVYNVENPLLGVNINWNDENNTTGINMSEVIFGDGTVDWTKVYPYIIIDNYVTMMTNGGLIMPLYNGGKITSFQCPTLPAALQTAATRTVSIALGGYDASVAGTWVELAPSTVLGGGGKFCSLPNAVAKRIQFIYKSNEIIIITNFTATLNPSNIAFNWTQGKDFGSYTKRIMIYPTRVSMDFSGTEPVANTYVSISSGTSTTVNISTILNNAGFSPKSGDIINFTCYFQYQDDKGNWVDVGNQLLTKMY
jgi:hypothetical protein